MWKLDIFSIQITFFGGGYSRYFLQTVHDVRHKIVLVPYSLLGKIFFFLKPPKGGPAWGHPPSGPIGQNLSVLTIFFNLVTFYGKIVYHNRIRCSTVEIICHEMHKTWYDGWKLHFFLSRNGAMYCSLLTLKRAELHNQAQPIDQSGAVDRINLTQPLGSDRLMSDGVHRRWCLILPKGLH